MATTNKELAHKGISTFVVEKEHPDLIMVLKKINLVSEVLILAHLLFKIAKFQKKILFGKKAKDLILQ